MKILFFLRWLFSNADRRKKRVFPEEKALEGRLRVSYNLRFQINNRFQR